MPPRLRFQPTELYLFPSTRYVCRQCRHASVATATTPAAPIEQMIYASRPIIRHPPTQPPSYKPPEVRKTQLHRQYQSTLHSTPLIVIFQHNNLKSTEWASIRRELATAMAKVDEELARNGNSDRVGEASKIQVIQTGIFASALRVVEFWEPKVENDAPTRHPTDPSIDSSMHIENGSPTSGQQSVAHGLSKQAYMMVNRGKNKQLKHGLEPLLSGPLAILTIPSVSPQHLKAALSILAPSRDFPAPKRRTNPGYYEPAVQAGLQKLMLLGARIEGKVFDTEEARWVGGIPGGLDGLRAQLVAMLSGVGANLTNTLEAASKSLYLTVESRRTMLEEEQKEPGAEPEKIETS